MERRIDGSLTEEEFKPLRLMNGLYLQLHAYMLRVAIPYGTLDSRQMRKLAHIAERWDKGYGHFTTRQNVQFNWPRLKDVPDILDALADVEMHAIQTSGNCVRNVTADHFAGAAADEIADPRPTAELLRQWSTDHPEFAFLPRKFKIAVSGSPVDRAVTRAHDVGIRIVRNRAGEIGHEVSVGGGLGRTPVIGTVICTTSYPRRTCFPTSRLSCRSTTPSGVAITSSRRASRSRWASTGIEAFRRARRRNASGFSEGHSVARTRCSSRTSARCSRRRHTLRRRPERSTQR